MLATLGPKDHLAYPGSTECPVLKEKWVNPETATPVCLVLQEQTEIPAMMDKMDHQDNQDFPD